MGCLECLVRTWSRLEGGWEMEAVECVEATWIPITMWGILWEVEWNGRQSLIVWSQVANTRTRDALGPAKEPSGTFGTHLSDLRPPSLRTPTTTTQHPRRSHQQPSERWTIVQEPAQPTKALSGWGLLSRKSEVRHQKWALPYSLFPKLNVIFSTTKRMASPTKPP